MIIYVKFSDDTFGQNPGGGAECTTDSTTEWPYDRTTIPFWGNDIIDQTDSGTHTVGSITDYFCKMSRDRNDGTHGKFHLIGEVYPELIVPDHSRSWYENTSNHGFANEWIAVNREILTKVDNDPQGLDLSIYDDYTNGTTNRTPDGLFDMIILIFRSHFGGFEGTSRLDGETSGISSTQFGSLQIDTLDVDGCFETGSGIISQGFDQIDTIELFAHEYGHRIFGVNHLDYIGRYGVMDGSNGAGAMSAYERERAGWIAPQVISSDQSDIQITESITTADIYKIFLPNTDEYLLLENRQNTFWTDTYWGDGDDFCDGIRLPGTGLMITHIDPPPGTQTFLGANELHWKRANGSSPTSIGSGDDTDPYKPGNQIQLSPWTTPDSDTRIGIKSGIAINDVRFSGSDILVDIDMDFTSGTLLENSIWSDAITVDGDFTLVSGKTLTVQPNTTISFASGSTDLWIEGTIIAEGTAGNPITFTASAASPQPSEWGTIFVESDDNTFEYCTVEYSDWGIKIYDTTYLTGNEVKNCTFKDNDQGLRFQNADVTVENNAIYDNRHGVVAINADGLFTGNSIYDNDRDGIYSVGGTLDFFSNAITGNGLGQSSTIHGIYASSGSDINVGGEFGTEGNPGYNEIYDNEGSGVHVDNSSTAFMGHKVGYGGYNSVYDNGVYSGYEVNNLNSSTVEAHKNWWGTSSPSSSQFNGAVDYGFHLTSPPVAPKVSGTSSRKLLSSSLSNKLNLVDSLKTAASTSTKAADRSSALKHYYSIVRRDKNDNLNEKSVVIAFLDSRLAAESEDAVKNQAFVFLLDAYLKQSQHQALLGAIAALPDYLTDGSKQAAYSYGIFANVAIGDYAAANKLVQTYEKQFPKASELVFLQQYIDGAQGILARSNSATRNANAEQIAETRKQAGGLNLQAYPNPFNPATQIRFSLQQEGEITIRIFNLLGEEVRMWEKLAKAAGENVVSWDGKDARGVEVGSGMYLFQLSYRAFEDGAKPVIASRKMTLIR